MNIVSIGIATASVVAGLAGAGVAYELATVDDPGTSASAPATESQRTKAERRIKWKPCQPPAVREGRACVTDEVRLVQIGGATSVASPAGVARSRDDDAPGHDLFDDHGGDRDDFDDDFDDHDDFDDFDDDHFDDHDSDDDSSGHDDDHDDDDSSGSGSGDSDDDHDDHDDDDDDRDD